MILKFFRRKAQPDVQLEQGLEKTRRGVFLEITRLFDRGVLDEEFYEELEMLLIQADVGWDVSQKLVSELRERVEADRALDSAAAREFLREEMIQLLEGSMRNRTVKILQRGVPFVVMVVGVNGVGKTTSIAKLAAYHQGFGRSVMVAAGDTFRAAAIDQLKVWGERLNVPVIAQTQGSDAGAVVFDAMQAAHARGVDVLIIDTAGRLHTKHNLMAELGKLRGIVQKTVPDAPQETILVIDATTGPERSGPGQGVLGLGRHHRHHGGQARQHLEGRHRLCRRPRTRHPDLLRRHGREGHGFGGVSAGDVRGLAVLRAGRGVLVGRGRFAAAGRRLRPAAPGFAASARPRMAECGRPFGVAGPPDRLSRTGP
jgi:fused signal recognition particle receptor